jgi:hypothetical protein
MRDVYEVLRQKELEMSRLQKEIEALRVAAPLLLADGEAEDDHQATLQREVNDPPQQARVAASGGRLNKFQP